MKEFRLQNTENYRYRKNCQLIRKSCLSTACSFVASLYQQNERIEIMKHSNLVQDAVGLIKEIFSEKPVIKNNLNSKEEYCEHHAIKDYYCETD